MARLRKAIRTLGRTHMASTPVVVCAVCVCVSVCVRGVRGCVCGACPVSVPVRCVCVCAWMSVVAKLLVKQMMLLTWISSSSKGHAAMRANCSRASAQRNVASNRRCHVRRRPLSPPSRGVRCSLRPRMCGTHTDCRCGQHGVQCVASSETWDSSRHLQVPPKPWHASRKVDQCLVLSLWQLPVGNSAYKRAFVSAPLPFAAKAVHDTPCHPCVSHMLVQNSKSVPVSAAFVFKLKWFKLIMPGVKSPNAYILFSGSCGPDCAHQAKMSWRHRRDKSSFRSSREKRKEKREKRKEKRKKKQEKRKRKEKKKRNNKQQTCISVTCRLFFLRTYFR